MRKRLCPRTDGPGTQGECDQASDALSVIVVPESAWLTGQLAFASSAALTKPASSRPGTVPTTVRWMPVMPVPGWKVTSAFVSSRAGGVRRR